MARRPSAASSPHRAGQAFHRRIGRPTQLHSTPSSQPTNNTSSAPAVSLPASPIPESIANASRDSSQLLSGEEEGDGSRARTNPTNKFAISGSRSVRQIHKPDSIVSDKRRKLATNRHDNEVAKIAKSYLSRNLRLDDRKKRVAEVADGGDVRRRRTRQSDGSINASEAQAKSRPTEPALPRSISNKASKRKTGATADFQGLSDCEETSRDSGALKALEALGESLDASAKRTEADLDLSIYPRMSMTRDPKTKLKFMLGLREHEPCGHKLTQTDEEDSFACFKSRGTWPEYRELGKTYFGVDGDATYRPESEARGSPARSNRGGGRGGRGRGGPKGNGNRGGGNGNGGRGRPKGRKNAGDDDSDPPRKRQLTEQEEEEIRRLKLRQQELKMLFSTVGAHQVELLDQLIARDLNKIVKKARVHTKVPEYEYLKDDLEDMMESQQDLARKRYETFKAAEIKRYEQEKELIETQYYQRCQDTHMEHLQGLQGDIISLKKAHATALDETRTEAGSEVDYFPRYHEFPEPDAHVRGYISSKITEEKPFMEYLESRGDLDLQDVINEDITGPMIESIQNANAKLAEEERMKQTQTMDALLDEANQRLDDMKGYLTPRSMPRDENDAYALSFLADVSGYMAKQHPRQQYIYMPLAAGEHLPSSVAALGQHLGQINGRTLAPAPTPVVSQAPSVTMIPSKRSRNKSKVSVSSISSISSNPPIRPSLSLHTQINGAPHTLSAASVAPSPVVSTGPGQPIAPAPPKVFPPFSATTPIMQSAQSPFRRPSEPASQRFQGFPATTVASMPPQAYGPPAQIHTSLPGSVPRSPRMMPSPRSTGASTGHQFIFQPPAGMPSSPRPAYGPHSPVGAPQGGSQGKIPVTFVNQTVASRKAAAVAKASRKHAADQGNDSGTDSKAPSTVGERRESGGQRMLLPKQ